MFDLLVKLLKNNTPVANALINVKYNTTELQKYTDANGEALFEDIPSNISKLEVIANIAEAWIRQLQITEDWEYLVAPKPVITEDWEELFTKALQITEDWEVLFTKELRITEDWEEFFTKALQITEDWEQAVALTLKITEDWEEGLIMQLKQTEDWETDYPLTLLLSDDFSSMANWTKDSLATYTLNAVSPSCISAKYGSNVAMPELHSGSSNLDAGVIYNGKTIKFGRIEAYVGFDYRWWDIDKTNPCSPDYMNVYSDLFFGLVLWRFNSKAIVIKGRIDYHIEYDELEVKPTQIIFAEGDYETGTVYDINVEPITVNLGDRVKIVAEIKPAEIPYVLIYFGDYMLAYQIPDTHIPPDGGYFGIATGGGYSDDQDNYIQPVFDRVDIYEYST